MLKDFAMKGNVVDLAVAVIIGAAFGKIIGSLVDDIIMPVIGAITGGLDFSNHFIGLSKAVTSPVYAEAKRTRRRSWLGEFFDRYSKFPDHRIHSVSGHSRLEHAEKVGTGRAAAVSPACRSFTRGDQGRACREECGLARSSSTHRIPAWGNSRFACQAIIAFYEGASAS
jgi:hypothetical protein